MVMPVTMKAPLLKGSNIARRPFHEPIPWRLHSTRAHFTTAISWAHSTILFYKLIPRMPPHSMKVPFHEGSIPWWFFHYMYDLVFQKRSFIPPPSLQSMSTHLFHDRLLGPRMCPFIPHTPLFPRMSFHRPCLRHLPHLTPWTSFLFLVPIPIAPRSVHSLGWGGC